MTETAGAAAIPDDGTLRRVLEVSRRLNASADLDDVLLVIIDAMRDLLDAERATVFVADADTGELVSQVAHGVGAKGDVDRIVIRLPRGAGIAGESAVTGTIINVTDAQADPRFCADVDEDTGFHTRSILSIPLVGYDDELIGVAQVLNKRDGPFDERDEAVAAALSSQAAMAVKRSQLIQDRLVRNKLERDLELARRIQRSFLPRRIPQLPGFDVAAWNEPAEETGGDTYDVIGVPAGSAPPEKLILLMADASGHGIGPALSVTQVRAMVRMAVRMDAPLGVIAANLNRQLHDDLPDDNFITSWLARLDGASATLTSFSAGQGPLLRYIAAEDRFEHLKGDVMPLGIVDHVDVTRRRRLAMERGDAFAVISDGIFESRSPAGNELGTTPIEQIIRDRRKDGAAAIIEAIKDAVRAHRAGSPATDDCTVVLIIRTD